MRKIFYPITLFGLISFFGFGQVKISDTGNINPNPESILHLESGGNHQGILLPRVHLKSIDNPFPLQNHIEGAIVFNLETTANLIEDLYYNDGTQWNSMSSSQSSTNTVGEIKHGLQLSDHKGWYLLDGRSINSLTATAKNNAESLGYKVNLPNANDTYLFGDNTGSLGKLSKGFNYYTLKDTNIPLVNFLGTTTSSGLHSHTTTFLAVDKSRRYQGGNLPGLRKIWTLGVLSTDTNPLKISEAGEHTHKLDYQIGTKNIPLDKRPKSLVTNLFIYLGV